MPTKSYPKLFYLDVTTGEIFSPGRGNKWSEREDKIIIGYYFSAASIKAVLNTERKEWHVYRGKQLLDFFKITDEQFSKIVSDRLLKQN